MKIEDNIIEEIFNNLKNKSNYIKRKKEIEKFNKSNSILKKRYSNNSCKIWNIFYNNSFKSSRCTSSYLY